METPVTLLEMYELPTDVLLYEINLNLINLSEMFVIFIGLLIGIFTLYFFTRVVFND